MTLHRLHLLMPRTSDSHVDDECDGCGLSISPRHQYMFLHWANTLDNWLDYICRVV